MFNSISPTPIESTIVGAYLPHPQPASLRTTNTLALCERALAERDAPVVRLLAIFSHIRRVALARLERKAQRAEPIPSQVASAPTLIIRPLWIIWPARVPAPRVVTLNSPSQWANSNNRWEQSKRLASFLIAWGVSPSPDCHKTEWITPDNQWQFKYHELAGGVTIKRRKPNGHLWIQSAQCATTKGEYEAIRAKLEQQYAAELEIWNRRIAHITTPAEPIFKPAAQGL